jgi:hypothetical protein
MEGEIFSNKKKLHLLREGVALGAVNLLVIKTENIDIDIDIEKERYFLVSYLFLFHFKKNKFLFCSSEW